MRRSAVRVVVLLFVLVLVTGCASALGQGADDGERVRVVATMSVLADFATNVGGDVVEVVSIVPLGGDPHAHEPTPSDAARIADADLVLDNGLGLSPWFRPLAAHARGPVVVLTEELRDCSIDAHDGVVDPHMWLAPSLALRYVDAIESALVEIDPSRAEFYAENAAGYRAELTQLDEELRGIIQQELPADRRKLVTYEDAFNYFAAEYDFVIVASAVGPTTEEEPTAAQIRRLIDRTLEEGVPAMFVEATVDDRVLLRAADDAGVSLEGPLFVDSLGEPGSGAETYVGMMRINVETLVEGLRGG